MIRGMQYYSRWGWRKWEDMSQGMWVTSKKRKKKKWKKILSQNLKKFQKKERNTKCSPADFSLSSLQFSRSVRSDSLRPHELQHARPRCPSPTVGVYSNSCPLNRWCHPTISSSVVPSPPTFNLSQHQGLFTWVSSLHQVAKVLEFQLQH